jgi:hypothetical protein
MVNSSTHVAIGVVRIHHDWMGRVPNPVEFFHCFTEDIRFLQSSLHVFPRFVVVGLHHKQMVLIREKRRKMGKAALAGEGRRLCPAALEGQLRV